MIRLLTGATGPFEAGAIRGALWLWEDDGALIAPPPVTRLGAPLWQCDDVHQDLLGALRCAEAEARRRRDGGMTAPRFETFQWAGNPPAAGAFGWRLVAGNGEKVAMGESYTRREDAERGVRDVVEAVLDILVDQDLLDHQAAIGHLQIPAVDD